MKDLQIPKYPFIIPELDLHPEKQTSINYSGLKHSLVSLVFYKRIEKNDQIYIKYRDDREDEFMPLFNLTKSICNYNYYIKTNKEKYLDQFKKLSKVLIDKMEKYGDMNGWKHKKGVVLPGYPEIVKSYSALFNGRGLSMLIRYYELNKTKSLEEKIKGVLETYKTESDDGGVMKKNGKDIWYLEYSYGNDSPVVFNGLFSALVGLYECSQYGPESLQSESKKLFNQGIETFKRNWKKSIYRGKFLDRFRYDDNKLFFADGDYGDIETRQMKYLWQKTDDEKIKKIYQEYQKIYKKNKYKAWIFEWLYFVYKKFFMS